MDKIANQIVDKWKEEIESIECESPVGKVTRIIESVYCFRMNKYYTGEGKIEYCYKVNFNFKDGLSSGKDNYDFSSWAIELSRYFTSKFGRGKTGYNQGEIEFKNELCDYMTYQGSRFIIQFYPLVIFERNERTKIEPIRNMMIR
jgi:hypothetical protein